MQCDHLADSKPGLTAEQNNQVSPPALDARRFDETFVSVEVQATAPAVAESVEQPMASDLLGDVGVTGRNARPWPHVSTLLSASAEPTTAKAVARLAWDIVDEWGDQSFPASDPPANW